MAEPEAPGGARCIDCAAGCLVCAHKIDRSLACLVCSQGYFQRGDSCVPCAKNCARCVDDTLAGCFELSPGFQFYDGRVVECSLANCSHCSERGDECLECKTGYLRQPVRAGEGTAGECRPCRDGCAFCAEKAGVTLCVACKLGFHRAGERCEPNASHCRFMFRERCVQCDFGYFVSEPDNKCRPIPVENCSAVSLANSRVCESCDRGFFFDGQSCLPCQSRQSFCSVCSFAEGRFVCLQCQRGRTVVKAGAGQQCRACPGNCAACDEQGRCLLCESSFVLSADATSCDKCAVPSCLACQHPQTCA